jgi:hypothetical protein
LRLRQTTTTEGDRKMTYLVETSYGDTIGTFSSVKASLKAIENHWQCGTAQNISEVRAGLRLMNIEFVSHILDNSLWCTIIAK